MEEPAPLLPSVIDLKKKKKVETKFVIGLDEHTTPRPPPPEGITNSAATATAPLLRRQPPPHRHHQHHVKRRTAGRMHKMTKAHLSDSEADSSKPSIATVAMRRSQSQRSLQQQVQKRRWSPQQQQQQQKTSPLETDEQRRRRSSASSSRSNPALFVSQQQMAAPIEQTFNAIANNLVSPNGAAYPACVHAAAASPVVSLPASPQRSSSSSIAKHVLRSQFISNDSSRGDGAQHQQQQHQHQHQHQHQQQKEEEGEGEEKRPPAYIARELDRIDREYQCLKQHRDPMMESLVRCMRVIRRSAPLTLPIHQHFNRTMSTSAIPSSSSSKALHSGHRQAAAALRRRQHHNQQIIANSANGQQRLYSSATTLVAASGESNTSHGGILSALWDRMLQSVN
ncbi:hypothetical protein BDB00DRAFT_867886 [Zychaea mexicana]|uniref:uncharacterized protein n=1 Tax=Zychaea mexicana TaxID=64656 RepID=UPI0022FF3E5E|nr:uncharacterized protein BDB00DRAFT_867886 [Zychaea mexicana]KAI9498248.1 hypothetical protein BDB00DRAFT_867886 [Zychaea mexicana]